MAKTNYNISLKGYVGSSDFDRSTVDRELSRNDGKEVNVLIDSTGGSLATGLSISAAFKNHGKVNVHFVGLNASAATIASLGAAHISIDAGAMYLVHKCSMAFFEWGSLKSDQFATLIADCEKMKADLDKLYQNVARLYAIRCKRKPEELLDLMKVGGWLTPDEALAWGFVDEITNLAEDEAPRMSDALASAMANAGMPIPNIPIADRDKDGAFGRFLSALSSLFKNQTNSITMSEEKSTSKTYSEDEYNAINARLTEANSLVDANKKTIEERDAKIAELEAKLAKKPAEPSKQVVEDSKSCNGEATPENEVEAFVNTFNSASQLFNEV